MRREMIYGIMGILLGVVATLATLAVVKHPGRYQIDSAEGRVYVLDTATGQVWLRTRDIVWDYGRAGELPAR